MTNPTNKEKGMIKIEDVNKILNLGDICYKLSYTMKPNKSGKDKGKIVINAEQLDKTLEIIKKSLKELGEKQ